MTTLLQVYDGHHFFGHERLFHPGFPLVVNPAPGDLRTVAQLPVVTPSGVKLVAPAFGAYLPAEPAKGGGVKPKQTVGPPSAAGRPTANTVTTDLAVEKSIMPNLDTAAKAMGSTVPL
ncbi:unnamed protein product [Cylicocyclus nassatus]|uniref:Uncharacterized protein n=1 Tax=Cylicocyclus nassatus TaxID=53992 RepID=A0AA36DQ73_CYLNA|nr:unnamed protein product [Cylicocyclus nassatus]